MRTVEPVVASSPVSFASVRAAEFMLRIPPLRKIVTARLAQGLSTSFDLYEDDDDALRHIRWLGSHLGSFLQRLIAERPAAARAMLRFLATWMQDMRRRTAMQRIEGEGSPCTVVIEPTDRCNLYCPGCYAKSSCDGSDLSYDQLVNIVNQVVDMGVTLITLSGGEPFLRERTDQTITRLARQFSNRGFLVYTNGTVIDSGMARRLGKVGNVFPAISVEGFEHHTDQRRGTGVSRNNRLARKYLAQNHVMAGFSATITRENAEAICTDDFIDLRLEEGDLFGWFFLLQPIGRSPRPDLMATAEQRAMLRETITRWREENRPIFLGDFWNDGHLTGGCLAGGKYYFHIYANGDISPCVFSPVACGNVLDIIDGKSPYLSLREFVRDNPVFKAFRREQASITDRDRPCLLIDNPDCFRRISTLPECRPAKNMAAGYTDGTIGDTIERASKEWRELQLAPTPIQQLSPPNAC